MKGGRKLLINKWLTYRQLESSNRVNNKGETTERTREGKKRPSCLVEEVTPVNMTQDSISIVLS